MCALQNMHEQNKYSNATCACNCPKHCQLIIHFDRTANIIQGAYNSGKPGNLREFVNSVKLRENSRNLKFTQGIYQMLAVFS